MAVFLAREPDLQSGASPRTALIPPPPRTPSGFMLLGRIARPHQVVGARTPVSSSVSGSWKPDLPSPQPESADSDRALRGNGSVPDLDGKWKSEMGLLSSPDSQQERVTLYSGCLNVE